VPELSRAG